MFKDYCLMLIVLLSAFCNMLHQPWVNAEFSFQFSIFNFIKTEF